jgi:DNA-binding beta-propeller fold protein YncE
MRGFACLAAAPDGKTIYVSGVASQKRYKPIKWKHAVYRAKWGEKTITPFIGNPEEAGKGGTGLNSPQGVALGEDGNIYVADRGNNRVAVFSPEGKFLSELPVESPYMLGVHRKSGAVYVLGGGDPPDSIIKFKSRGDPRPVYNQEVEHVVKSFKGKRLKRLDAYPVFTLDASAEEPVLWVGSSTVYTRLRLSRSVEKNGKLGELEEKGRGSGFRACREIHVDRKREVVYFQQRAGSYEVSPRPAFVKINGVDGKVLKSLVMRGTGSHFALGRDGYVYVIDSTKHILRYDRDFKPANFPGTDSNASDPLPGHKYSLHIMGRGLAVSRDGTIYVLHENVPKVHTRYGVSVWGPDGKVKKENLIGSLSPAALSLRMDPAGNLYVGDPVKPAGQVVPPDFQGRANVAKLNPHHGEIPDNHYPIMYGSILKFPASGGAGVGPKIEGGRQGLVAYDVPVGIKDDLWQYSGVCHVPAQHGAGYNHYVTGACACEGMRFDVDDYGRVFSPDAGRFRVVVLDTGGNELCTFGAYGNQDSPSTGSGPRAESRGAGPGSAVPEPEIPLTWPSSVGVSDRAAYVSDLLSRRVVRVKLGHAAEETCRVP